MVATTDDVGHRRRVGAWGITTGSAGVVIADVDTGVRFDHPDLLRAGLGGRLAPGLRFRRGRTYNPSNGRRARNVSARERRRWLDPDPSDPGDWISSADQQNPLFPAADCPAENSTWHGTRVVGVYGAITNNDVGTAGMTWGSPSRRAVGAAGARARQGRRL